MNLSSSGDWSVADPSEHNNAPFRSHKSYGIYWLATRLLTSEHGFCFMLLDTSNASKNLKVTGMSVEGSGLGVF